jgi:hypothetical protein
MGNLQTPAKACKMALPKVRDQEVTGSNPVAPTILFSITYTLSPSEKVVVAITATQGGRPSLPNSHLEMPSSNLSRARSNELPILQSVVIPDASPEAGGQTVLCAHRA